VVGLIQGISEMVPVSSLGHAVLIPAVAGGSWARDLNVARSESPYLAFIVGMHVATAFALVIYFWRDWLRIIGGFFSSLRQRRVDTADQKLAWIIILATIPVGLVGLAFEHSFRVIFGKPILAGIFLTVNGLILIAGERYRSRASRAADTAVALAREPAPRAGAALAADGGVAAEGGMAADGGLAVRERAATREREREQADALQADLRLASMSYAQAVVIGSAQILALLAGISRDGIAMVAGMTRGLSREDAARFAFLLATPVILAAGVLKIPDLLGPLGNGIRGQIVFGSVLAGLGAYLSVRFLLRYVRTRTLTPFGVYCLIAGLASVAYLGLAH
jgi:undecaprenyl-diphosphatase